MNNKNFLTITILLMIIIVLGAYFGSSYYYHKGIADTRAKLERIGILQPIPKVSLAFSGKIISNDGHKLSVQVLNSYDPLADASNFETKTVLITSTTDIISRIFSVTKNPGPVPYSDKKIDLSKLSVGDQIFIQSASNVMGASEVTASQIIVAK